MSRVATITFVVVLALVVLVFAFVWVDTANAQTGTPPPPTGTAVICPSTPTGTSILPTFILPTVDNSTPCPGGCPATATPELTATVTPTQTATVTPTPTGLIVGCVHSAGSSCVIAPDGQSAHFDIQENQTSGFLVGEWYVILEGSGTVYMVPDVEYSYTATDPQNPSIHRTSWLSKSGTITTFFYDDFPSGGITGSMTGTYSTPFTTSQNYYGHVALYNTLGSGTITGTADFYLDTSFLTPTAIATPTALPCVPGEIIDTEIIDWHPPQTEFGQCIVIMPAMQFDVPGIVEDADPTIPDIIGIPGVELCLWYWVWDVGFAGLSLMTGIGMICAMIGAAMIIREFRS